MSAVVGLISCLAALALWLVVGGILAPVVGAWIALRTLEQTGWSTDDDV